MTAPSNDLIRIFGARQHNLKDLRLEIPRGRLTVVTGLSGSGKSSLAFDTLYAEGQRRYVESLSAYARQFLELMEKPDVDLIEGLSPAISIEQRNPSRNPRSTVATVTEIYDYFRLLFARVGKPHCPKCGKPIQAQSAAGIVKEVLRSFADRQVLVFSPLVRGRTGTYDELFQRLKRSGFATVRVNGTVCELVGVPKLKRYQKQTIELLVDKLEIVPDERERLADSVEIALKESGGLVLVQDSQRKGDGRLYSEHHSCPDCGISLPELEPRLFSFNSPYGACPECGGLGVKTVIAEELVVPDPALAVKDGALAAWSNPVTTRTHRWKRSWSGYYEDILAQVCRQHRIPLDVPYGLLPREQKDILLFGGGTYRAPWAGKPSEFEGVVHNLERRQRDTESDFVKEEIHRRFMREIECQKCRGARLKEEARHVRVGDISIVDLCRLSVRGAREFFAGLRFSPKDAAIARQIMKEIESRLEFLLNVGLDYLTLDRRSETLAGGEAQRIHLATQIGSGLTGVLYVLDEPSIGLHPRDNTRLLATLKRLRDLGNTLVVVEHDEETIRSADWILDLGPGAGIHGGRLVAEGPLEKILASPESLTARYLNGELRIGAGPKTPRRPKGRLVIRGAAQFNLKDIDVPIPLGLFTCVTGVSGSGKSTLVHEVLYKALVRKLAGAKETPGKHRSIEGIELLDKVIVVDQSPIGRTPRSNPATYTGFFSDIRDLFARLPESRKRGYQPGRFSFNVKGGRCEACKGDGTLRIQMQFLPDVYVKCEECTGGRFNEDTLQVRYKGKTIAEVLDMTVEEALAAFAAIPAIRRPLQTLADVGLSYIRIGQSAVTLSGGEAQRVKLATELSRRATGRTLYILDEPTTGLHFADVAKLLEVLHRLVDNGNTIVVIEHNLDVVKTADWIVDLGPEGGDRGGRVVVSGSPQKVAACEASHTGQYLRRLLSPSPRQCSES
ncbi:MAG: excinuclease ABC subunit A [Elusimicrobia bacterium GWA2_69_24]|nr:MAG: excinuclease ABC subunit A [Elusimicrobia bacterium GWA2_69_24]